MSDGYDSIVRWCQEAQAEAHSLRAQLEAANDKLARYERGHIVGKVYDLTAENMNALIGQLEAAQARVQELEQAEALAKWLANERKDRIAVLEGLVREAERVCLDVCAKDKFGPEMEELDIGYIYGLAERARAALGEGE